MASSDDWRAHFDALFSADVDPWRFRQRWYEARKRALTMACLRRPRYASAFEPGCANGELSATLALRCDRLLISDGAATAIASALERVAGQSQVSAICAWLPGDWPDGKFDLIVLSELVYYLDEPDIDLLASKARASLQPGGDLVACHWRHPIEGCCLGGDAVHDRLAQKLQLPRVWSLVDADFRLEIWSTDTRTVAKRERLV
ncbi:MAG: SAM-dependent methyltransferase [Burkholderiaceae bacterium]